MENAVSFILTMLLRTANYNALRKATNTTFPGYLSHEAVVWHPGTAIAHCQSTILVLLTIITISIINITMVNYCYS